MTNLYSLPTYPYLDAMQGAGEERTELYFNTVKEYRGRQRRSAPRATGPAGLAGRPGGGMECVG
jgi:hypothetical protein